jgi:K+-transporting ATPase ATPase C chain
VIRTAIVALRMALATLALTGILYPLLMTGMSRALFPRQANGGMVTVGGRVVGSELIGQRFEAAGYFQGRPSAAGAAGYDASASGGSNLGPTSKALRDRVAAETTRLRASNPDAPGPVPAELVTASGSGLDPHVSPPAARWQAPRIAAARGVRLADVESLIAGATEPRTLGLLGEPRVNVLLLNVALDRKFGPPGRSGG